MEESLKKILLVEDDPNFGTVLKEYLSINGYDVIHAKNGMEGFEKFKKDNYDLCILDVMMPEMDGIEACGQIRLIPELKDTLIAFLTARGEDYSQLAGYEAGADDYITKPIKPKVLISKIRALLRRLSGSKSHSITELINVGDLTINRETYQVLHKGNELVLPRKEFELVSLLA